MLFRSMKVCARDYDPVCRAVDKLKKQNIIHQVDGRWQMVTSDYVETYEEFHQDQEVIV